MKLFLFALVILTTATFHIHAQVGIIKGVVTDKTSKQPISGASIFIRGVPSSALSQNSGNFLLSHVPFGDVEIQVRKAGYQNIALKTNIKSLGNGLDIQLATENSVISKHAKALDKYREKVVVITDKPYYYPKDIIWLKAYVNCITPNLRDSLSHVTYVDFIDSDNKVLKHLTLSQDSGRFQGQIVLPIDLKPGNYMIVAYTNFMRNFGDDYFYYQAIPVLAQTQRVEPSNSMPERGAEKFVFDEGYYYTRDRVSVYFKDLPEGDYTVAVTDATQVAEVAHMDISQAWSFSNNFNHEQTKLEYITEKGVRFIGQFVNELNTGKRAKLTFYRKDRFDLADIETNDDGIFQINGLKFYDSATYFVTAYSPKSKKASKMVGSIKLLDEPVSPPKTAIPNRWFSVVDSKDPQRFLADYLVPADSKLLDKVTVIGTRLTDESSNLPGIMGGADTILKGSEIVSHQSNLLRALQGRVPGLIINCNEGSLCSIHFFRAMTSSAINMPAPLVLVDNVPVAMSGQSVTESLMAIDPLTVERIEFKRGLAPLYASQAAGGVIAVYLKKGSSIQADKPKEIRLTLKGFSRPKDFVSPDYGSLKQDNSIADYRSTLYWNPELTKDSEG
ncbi:MAG: carboxypeptidase regulatory-like domain-containing protein, partial [Flammeovirgaceae bacterium]